MKRILVTGSLGYIGSELINYLKEKNYACSGLDIGYFKDCNLIDGTGNSVVKNQSIRLEDGKIAWIGIIHGT